MQYKKQKTLVWIRFYNKLQGVLRELSAGYQKCIRFLNIKKASGVELQQAVIRSVQISA